jgi:hypothetical protein
MIEPEEHAVWQMAGACAGTGLLNGWLTFGCGFCFGELFRGRGRKADKRDGKLGMAKVLSSRKETDMSATSVHSKGDHSSWVADHDGFVLGFKVRYMGVCRVGRTLWDWHTRVSRAEPWGL